MSSMATTDHRGSQSALEPPTFMYDRRKSPDRRDSWRGGRRDSDWISRPPGALRRFEKLQRRAVRFGKWRVPLPFTGSGRRVHPFLGLWGLLIVAVLTFSAARTNQVLLEVLFEIVTRPPNQQPLSADDGIVMNA